MGGRAKELLCVLRKEPGGPVAESESAWEEGVGAGSEMVVGRVSGWELPGCGRSVPESKETTGGEEAGD
jgi:hypothetical protein